MKYKPMEAYLVMPWSYTLEWWEDSGGYYAVKIAELPGCVADGQTPEEALANSRDAVKSYILSLMEEGEEIPEPVVDKKQFKGRIPYRTDMETHWRLHREAQRRGMSINKLIDEAVKRAIS